MVVSFILGWIPRYFEIFLCKPKLSCLRENHKNGNLNFREFTPYMPFQIYHENSHYRNGNFQKKRENHIKGGFVLVILFVNFPQKWHFWLQNESFWNFWEFSLHLSCALSTDQSFEHLFWILLEINYILVTMKVTKHYHSYVWSYVGLFYNNLYNIGLTNDALMKLWYLLYHI